MAAIYSDDLKAQILEEVKQVKNTAKVADKHNLPLKTVQTWLKKQKSLDKQPRLREVKELKAKLADTELELAILKDLLKKSYLL